LASPRITSLRDYYKGTRAQESILLEWENVSYSTFVKDPKRKCPVRKDILQSVSGYSKSGELLAIMGPTGCGKTSLMNILAARVPSGGANTQALSGAIKVNGTPRNEQQFRNISAYVLQDDFLYPHLTVHETVLLAAHFFLPSNKPDSEKLELVDIVIAELGLRKARDTIIGDDKIRGVSGGERKRANIAVQLITDPAVLFLDEPTSGLDAFQALSVMECMKDLAENGRLVISVIHQPRSSIYNMFDRLLLLSEGRTMFFGKSSDAVDHFAKAGHACPSSFNPADYFLDILSPDSRTEEAETRSTAIIKTLGDIWHEKVQDRGMSSGNLEEGANSNGLGSVELIGGATDLRKLVRNMLLLCWRAWAEQSRDLITLFIKCMITTFFAFIIGGIYSNIGLGQKSIQNRNGLLFFVAINQGFNGLIGVLNTFPKEKNIVNRERAGRAYNTLSYFFAKFFVEIPLNCFPSVLYSCIIYWIVGLNSARFGEFIGIGMIETCVAVALGLAVSAAAPSVEAATAIGPLFMVIGILFGGFYIDIGSLPIVANWIPYFSFLRWAFEAYCINEYTGMNFDCKGAAPGACRATGEQVLTLLSFDGHTTSYPVFGLGMVLLAFLSVSYVILDMSKARYTPLGHKGSKFDSLAAAAAKAAADYQPQSTAVVEAEPITETVGLELTK